MSLQNGQQIQAETTNNTLTVKKKLGEGGQGVVYLVEGLHGEFALKWYNVAQASSEQKEAIRYLVQNGAPPGRAGRRFIWPVDVVTAPQSAQFGYLMPLIDTCRFSELGEVQARLKPAPGLAALCEISFKQRIATVIST